MVKLYIRSSDLPTITKKSWKNLLALLKYLLNIDKVVVTTNSSEKIKISLSKSDNTSNKLDTLKDQT